MSLAPQRGWSNDQIVSAIDAILAQATLEEKVAMMSGHGFFKAYKEDGVWGGRPYRAGGGCERLGVPALWFTDGPRGVARGSSTCFPCTMARGASFDVALERRIGEVMGIEARAQGCNLSGAVCINLLRHPAWGRAQETYGEDPFHLGEMGVALGLGIQTHNVIATVKHFALNSMENARFYVDVVIDEATLHDVYLPHFKRALSAGVASVMSAYNKVNGVYCGQNAHLLTSVLREEWGFEGFVHSDWVKGVYDVSGAAAGLDVENPEPLVWGDKLVQAVTGGEIDAALIDRACRRILTTLYHFLSKPDPLPAYSPALVAQPSHVALAREAAEKSAVLLENDGVLPFKRDQVKRLAVLGRLADLENTGDRGSSRVRAPWVVTPLAGLRNYLGNDAIVRGDERDLEHARSAAASADAVVVVVGYTYEDEGEFIPGDISLGQGDGPAEARPRREAIGGDRLELGLPKDQIELIRAASAAGKPLVVVIVSGSAVLVEEWRDRAGAILQTFYAGMEGGSALARLLFGEVSPSGRLPFTVALDAADYPFFDRDAQEISYTGTHGYSKFLAEQRPCRYAFGHGLSYASFAVEAFAAKYENGAIDIVGKVTNETAFGAETTLLLFVKPKFALQGWSDWLLKGFAKVAVPPNGICKFKLELSEGAFARRCTSTHTDVTRSGEYAVGLSLGSVGDVEVQAVVSVD